MFWNDVFHRTSAAPEKARNSFVLCRTRLCSRTRCACVLGVPRRGADRRNARRSAGMQSVTRSRVNSPGRMFYYSSVDNCVCVSLVSAKRAITAICDSRLLYAVMPYASDYYPRRVFDFPPFPEPIAYSSPLRLLSAIAERGDCYRLRL